MTFAPFRQDAPWVYRYGSAPESLKAIRGLSPQDVEQLLKGALAETDAEVGNVASFLVCRAGWPVWRPERRPGGVWRSGAWWFPCPDFEDRSSPSTSSLSSAMKQHPFHLARALLHLCLLALVSGAGCFDRPASSGAGEAPVPKRPAGGREARVREEFLAAMRERATMRERFGDPGVMWLVPQGKPTHDLAALLVDFEK